MLKQPIFVNCWVCSWPLLKSIVEWCITLGSVEVCISCKHDISVIELFADSKTKVKVACIWAAMSYTTSNMSNVYSTMLVIGLVSGFARISGTKMPCWCNCEQNVMNSVWWHDACTILLPLCILHIKTHWERVFTGRHVVNDTISVTYHTVGLWNLRLF